MRRKAEILKRIKNYSDQALELVMKIETQVHARFDVTSAWLEDMREIVEKKAELEWVLEQG